MPLQIPSAILMVRPAAFHHNPETAGTNAFQAEGSTSTDRTSEAQAEFDQMVEVLKDAGIELHVFQSLDTESPDAIFPNNWFISFPNGHFVLCPMLAPNRRREKNPEVIGFLLSITGIDRIEDWSSYEVEDKFLEGTGSIVYDHAGKTAYAARSPRTDEGLFNQLCMETGYRPVMFDSFGPTGGPVYHTNVVLHIGNGYAVLCAESIPDSEQRGKVLSLLESGGRVVIDISMDQMEAFAGNMLQVSGRNGRLFTVCSQTAFEVLSAEQKRIIESFSSLLPVRIPVIEQIGGGSARCMLAELFVQHR